MLRSAQEQSQEEEKKEEKEVIYTGVIPIKEEMCHVNSSVQLKHSSDSFLDQQGESTPSSI